jgi:hypothetical protein
MILPELHGTGCSAWGPLVLRLDTTQGPFPLWATLALLAP